MSATERITCCRIGEAASGRATSEPEDLERLAGTAT